MKRLAGVLAVLVATFFVLGWAVGGGPFYRFTPVDVQVLDYDSERPVAGAVVAARWYRSSVLCIHGDCIVNVAEAAETITGADGRARLRPSSRLRLPLYVVSRDSPEVIVHKAGLVVASGPSWTEQVLRPGTGKYFLLSPLAFADGVTRLGLTARTARVGKGPAESPASRRFPQLEREILKTYSMLAPAQRSNVREVGGPDVAWLSGER